MVAVPREVVPLAAASLLRELSRALAEGPGGRGAADDRESLRAAIAAYTGARHVFLLPDGRTGLYALLAPLGRAHPGAEVVLPDYNFFAVPEMVRRAGLTPVFVDVTAPHGEPTIEAVERALTPRTRALSSWVTTSAAPTTCAPGAPSPAPTASPSTRTAPTPSAPPSTAATWGAGVWAGRSV